MQPNSKHCHRFVPLQDIQRRHFPLVHPSLFYKAIFITHKFIKSSKYMKANKLQQERKLLPFTGSFWCKLNSAKHSLSFCFHLLRDTGKSYATDNSCLSIGLISNFEEFLVKKKKKSTKHYFITFENDGLTEEYQLYCSCSKWIKGQPHAKQVDRQRNHFSHITILIGKDV